MQALLLACYLCLQLTSISDLSESVVLKRDTSCDQCLSGLFNDNEILSVFKTQGKSSGEIVASHKLIREVVEQRLAKYESNGAESSQKSKEESESEKRNRLERFLAEENQKVIEAKTNQRKAAEEVEKELTERRRQLREQQAQENREFEEYVKKLRETVKIYENPTMKDINSPFMHVLRNEFRLMAGQYLLSENGRYKATMQESCSLVITDEFRDGNIVTKVGPPTHFRSGPECHMIMQDDGNLVLYSKITNGKSDQASWHTGRNSGFYVKLEDNGDLVMYNQEHRKVWAQTNGGLHTLKNNVFLMAGQYLVSENGRYKATMQESCTLVITDEFRDGIFVKKVGSPTHYISSPECHMIMQDDGNLVIYSKITNGKGSQVTWSTGTNSRKGPGYYVKLEDTGDLAMYNQNNRQIWTGSKGKLHAHRYDL